MSKKAEKEAASRKWKEQMVAKLRERKPPPLPDTETAQLDCTNWRPTAVILVEDERVCNTCGSTHMVPHLRLLVEWEHRYSSATHRTTATEQIHRRHIDKLPRKRELHQMSTMACGDCFGGEAPPAQLYLTGMDPAENIEPWPPERKKSNAELSAEIQMTFEDL